MAEAAYIVTNLLNASGVAITSETEDADFLLANLHDEILGLPFKFTVTTGGWVEFDFGSAQNFDTVFIGGHNHDSSATYNITAGASPAPAGSIGTPAWRANNIWDDVGSQNFRYLRIDVTDSNSENSWIGQVVVGQRVALPRSPRFGIVPGHTRADIFHETQRRVAWSYHLAEQEIREYLWRVLESEVADFETLHKAVQGRILPFLFIPDVAAVESLYVRNVEADFRPTELADPVLPDPVYEVPLKVKQESFGEALVS